MKIRRGFISNSSSSSFICDFCGEDVSGWDMNLSDAGMYQCEHGHCFCITHALEAEDIEEKMENADDPYSIRDSVPEKYCPLCQFQSITNFDLARYLLKRINMSREQVLAEVKAKYHTFKAFAEYTK